MASVKTYVKKNGSVFLIVTFRGSRFQVSTGITAKEKFTGSEFPKTDPNFRAKSARLMRIIVDSEDYILRHQEESVSDMKEHLKAVVTGSEIKPKAAKSLVDYMNEFASKKGGSTASIYRTTANRIETYDSKCTFDTITKGWLENYKQHEINVKDRALNGVAIDLRNIRAVFNWAIDNGLTTCYPFRKFQIKTERTPHLFLPAEEIRKLRDIEVEPYQEVYRDIFMLGFYLIGINISDLLELKAGDYRFGRIIYRRNKTHRLYDIKVEPEAAHLINKYKGKKHLLRFLDDGSSARTFNRNINDALKRIGKMEIVKNKRGAYVKKSITPIFPDIVWYTARRSWATIAASLDIPKETIGKALGHSEWDSSTTDIYIQFDNKKIDAANRMVLDAIK